MNAYIGYNTIYYSIRPLYVCIGILQAVITSILCFFGDRRGEGGAAKICKGQQGLIVGYMLFDLLMQ